jgi:hypothetical protein
MSARLCTFSLLLAASALVIAYGIGELWGWAILMAGLGIFGGFGPRNLRTRFGNGWLLSLLVAAASGMMIGLPALPLVIAAVASLAYWDLDGFHQRLSSVDPSDMTRSLEKSHLRRLALALSLGLAVSLVALPIQIDLSMAWAILLGLVIVISLRLGIAALQRQKKPAA